MIELKQEWIIVRDDGSESINPRVFDDMATALRALQSIASGNLTGVHSHKDTVEAMRQIAQRAIDEIGVKWLPLPRNTDRALWIGTHS